MKSLGAHTFSPALETLPTLVRRQRRLEGKIAPLAAVVVDEKALRKDIDALLVLAGVKKSEAVTCLGYDVEHHERKGQSALNQITLTEILVDLGAERDLVVHAIAAATVTADSALYASVTPCKGAKVRT